MKAASHRERGSKFEPGPWVDHTFAIAMFVFSYRYSIIALSGSMPQMARGQARTKGFPVKQVA